MSQSSFSALELIARRRDGLPHSADELRWLAQSAADGTIPDYQLAAWLMAAVLNPLDERQTADLTVAMAASGERLDLSPLPRPWVDKHSTGGVGDKTTLVGLPLMAACGLTVVKMSGRGLGITGGTVDKLASVPGFRVDMEPEELIRTASQIGIALAGQTARLAPADKTLYALRDATSTVASLPLIVSSILSKKLASGAEHVVLDVKCGSGGFMACPEQAFALAHSLERVGTLCGLNVKALVSDMEQPLGRAVGNRLEVWEALETLRGSGPERLVELVVELVGHLLVMGGIVADLPSARALARVKLSDGSARQKAKDWFEAQGADPALCDDPGRLLAEDMHQVEVLSPSDGWVARWDARTIGEVVVDLGGGRKTKEDLIDPDVGVISLVELGQKLEKGQPLARVVARTAEHAQKSVQRLLDALQLSPDPVDSPDLFLRER